MSKIDQKSPLGVIFDTEASSIESSHGNPARVIAAGGADGRYGIHPSRTD